MLAVASGKKTLAASAGGIAVTKIQRALVDLGQTLTASGTIDATTQTALKAFQTSKHLSVVARRKADLLLIHKAWPGFQADEKIYIQRIQTTNASGKVDKATGRSYMWDTFQTIIHEYLHTLEHPAHRKMRQGVDEQKGGFVLREGTTDYFTKIAYNQTSLTPSLRQAVEGPFHEPSTTHVVPPLTTYRESMNAERVAGIVGLPNLCGSFFLGQTELIGK